MASRRYTLRLPPALDAAVQQVVHEARIPFADLMRDALTAYLADTPPTGAPTAADTPLTASLTGADRLQRLEEHVALLTTRVDQLTQARTPRRQRATTKPTGADTPPTPYDPTRYFLGGLCPRRHDYAGTRQSLRKRSNHSCQRCDVEQKRARRQQQRDEREGRP